MKCEQTENGKGPILAAPSIHQDGDWTVPRDTERVLQPLEPLEMPHVVTVDPKKGCCDHHNQARNHAKIEQ